MEYQKLIIFIYFTFQSYNLFTMKIKKIEFTEIKFSSKNSLYIRLYDYNNNHKSLIKLTL